ncbi:hypothetical protein KKG83_08300 [Candidatus Micrarchaeota archaeon]|nr:hypothetical protein [Candidatus Micrarchaeota archaeon]
MKKQNKILLILVLSCLIVSMAVELTSSSAFYRDPYMFRHFDAAEFILEKQRINVIKEDSLEGNFVGWEIFNGKYSFNFISRIYLYYKNIVFFPVPVLSGSVFSLLSGFDIYFLFNHFYFLIFISALSFFVLFREIFNDNKIALGVALIVVFFPFESLYYKITIHGWHFVRIFSSLSLYFLVRLIKTGFSFRSKNFFFLLVFSFLGVYSDKTGFALVLLPLISFFSVFFFIKKKEFLQKKKFLVLLSAVFFLLLFFSFFSLFNDFYRIFQAIEFNLLNLNFLPSFLFPKLPFSEFYLEKNLFYILLRYLFPALIVFFFLALGFKSIKSFFNDKIIFSFLLSQFLFYSVAVVPMLFSFFFVSSSGATFIFFFLCWLSFIALFKTFSGKKKYFLISVFFVFVLIIPFVFYLNSPQFLYEQTNKKHAGAVEWINSNLSSKIIYSDVKMAKLVSLKTDSFGVNSKYEFVDSMEKEIIPVFFGDNTKNSIEMFESYSITHLLLSKEMDAVAVQPSNELLKPATGLKKFDSSSNFDKLFENKQARIYEINYN